MRRLAYTLKGQREGRYYLAQFAAPTQTINDLDRSMRLIEEVLRHIIVQIDKVEMPESPEEPGPAEAEAPAPAVEAEAAVPRPRRPKAPLSRMPKRRLRNLTKRAPAQEPAHGHVDLTR